MTGARKRWLIAALGLIAAVVLTGCTDADVVSQNLSTDADSFKINRMVVLHDDITDSNIASIEGLCSLGNNDSGGERTVTCKIGPDKYAKEIFQMGDNTSLTSVQTEPTASDPYHYSVVFKPGVVVPHLQVEAKDPSK